jgi:hypothetical protein
MPTQATVIRNALRLAGEPSNVGIDSDKKIVREMLGAYDDVVKAAFESHSWNSFKTLVQLTSVTPAVPGWDYTFNVPASFARVIHVSNVTREDLPAIEYGFQAGKILTNSPTTWLWFVDRTYEAQVGGWPQTFANMVSAMLANEVYPINDEADATRQRIGTELVERTNLAKSYDGSTDPTMREPVGAYVTARRSHLFSRRG